MVLDNSRRGPVMVYFWSPATGPCMRLLPRLVKLADEFGGRFLLTLLNTDQFHDFSKQQGVISIPTVCIYNSERISETIHGAFSEQYFRRTIEKYIRGPNKPPVTEPAIAYRQEALTKTSKLKEDTAKIEPINVRAHLHQAKLLVQQQRHETALTLLEHLPNSALEDPEVDLLMTHLRFIREARRAPTLEILQEKLAAQPDDANTRYQLSAQLLVHDQYTEALEHLYEILKIKSPLKERARRGMLAILAILGPDHALCKRFEDALRNTR